LKINMPCCDFMNYTYCGRCYTTSSRNLLPFGFCRPCWLKKGRPVKMTVEEYIAEEEPANQ
jgi:hypothetical protein